MPVATSLSKERIEDSSDEESSSSEAQQTSKPKSKNPSKKVSQREESLGIRPAAQQQQSSSSDSESTGDESDATASSTTSTSTGSKRKAKATSIEASGPTAKRPKPSTTTIMSTKSVEPTKYIPPHGYTATRTHHRSADTTSPISKLLQTLQGTGTKQQLWHISAPSSFPISKLGALDLAAALDGGTSPHELELEHNGVTYTLTLASTSDEPALALVPMPNGEYSSARPHAHITRSLRVSATATAPPHGEPTTTATATATTATSPISFFATRPLQKKPPRTQPPALRGRFTPYGVDPVPAPGTGARDPDTVMADAPASTPVSTPKGKAKGVRSVDAAAVPEGGKTPSKRKMGSSALVQTDSPAKDTSHEKKEKRKKKEKKEEKSGE